MNINEAKTQLMALQSKLSAYNHALELISYDEATIAPKGAIENHAHALSVLCEEQYKISTCDQTISLLEYLSSNLDLLSEEEQRMVVILHKDIKKIQKIPMDEYTSFQSFLSTAYSVWVEAKTTNNFELFRPVLEKIFDTSKRFANYCSPEMDPYDYWLDQYEEGLDKAQCEAFFATLKSRIVPLVEKIKSAAHVDDECLHGTFCDGKQREFSNYLMDILGINKEHCILGTTEHPFTTSIGSHHDERITTHYIGNNFSSSMFSVIHECGHALYNMGSEDKYAYTVLDGGVSMGIHESQSRLYENILCRSQSFTVFLLPIVKKYFADGSTSLNNSIAEDLYKAINKVEPSLIRTDADEVTYCLHIMIRYEIEKKAMSGQLEVKDFPREWNRLYKQYLGLDVPDDTHGVLQDSHWALGYVGYFPSYALGSAYGAQFIKKMSQSIDIDNDLSAGFFGNINTWNKENIWKYGKLYCPKELLGKVLGEPFDPNIFADYLENKYTKIYSII